MDQALADGFNVDTWDRLYRLQFKEPQMAHYISSHSYSSVYFEMLSWLTENIKYKPSRICEIGCNNGLFTLCLSKYWPEASVLGIDKNRTTIGLAMDICEKYNKVNLGMYDLVVVPFVFHEILDKYDGYPIEMIENLEKLISPQGLLFTVNRFPYADKQKT